MNSKNPLIVYRYLQKEGAKGATWEDLIKGLKIGQGSLDKALKVLFRNSVVKWKTEAGERGQRKRFFIDNDAYEILWKRDADYRKAGHILSQAMYHIRARKGRALIIPVQNSEPKMTHKDMLWLRNKLGQANFSTPQFRRFMNRKVKILDDFTESEIREFMKLLGYGFDIPKANYTIKQNDKYAIQKALLTAKFLED